MNRGFFLGALVVLTITVVLFIAGWPPAPCPAKWFVGVLGLLLMLLAFSKRKPLLPPTLAEFPPPHGTTAGQLVLLHEFFDLFQTVEEYSYQPGSEALDLFFRANEDMESKMPVSASSPVASKPGWRRTRCWVVRVPARSA